MKMTFLSFKNIMAILVFKFCIDGGQNLSKSAPLQQTASESVLNLYIFAPDLISKMPDNA
jgi:hypothetical protein